MNIVSFLIFFPMMVAIGNILTKPGKIQNMWVLFGALGIFIGTLALVGCQPQEIIKYFHGSVWVDRVILVFEFFLAIYIFYVGIKLKRFLICVLIFTQFGILTGFEIMFSHSIHVPFPMFIDKLSILMSVVVGIIGSVICLYATGYMKNFHLVHHQEIEDNRPLFFAVMFVFMSAMFGIIFSNNLLWLYFFWEVTTLCSFLLIE